MMLSRCSAVSLNIGIPACGVVRATERAVEVMPAVVANARKVGARAFGD